MNLKKCAKLSAIYISYILGLLMFISGFLLKRIVVDKNNAVPFNVPADICTNITSLHSYLHQSNQYFDSYNPLKRFDKAIIILIDALRFDFAFGKGSELYHNKMPVFRRLLRRKSYSSALYNAVADPPTTTLQRLTGLTTGSLPTFIDVGLNFASEEISEDNLIRRMKQSRKKMVFLGDDTWNGLFPDHFSKTYPYPSFNVMDLDSVDDGILSHLYEEMTDDNDIVIAHFLGVDHCGHRYGPDHPEMSRKLEQMNSVIQNVTERLHDDTILVVLGDHGMTRTGDHGGDSDSELSTVLFLYSNKKLIRKVSKNIHSVAQVDVVPTLSLLLGLPIPFSNLGSIIPNLFHADSFKDCAYGNIGPPLAAFENALQVKKYLSAYMAVSNEMSQNFLNTSNTMFEEMLNRWHEFGTDKTKYEKISKEILSAALEYLKFVKRNCEGMWATFNMPKISLGLICVLITLFSNLWCANKFDVKYLGPMAIFIFPIIILGPLYIIFDMKAYVLLFVDIIVAVCICSYLTKGNLHVFCEFYKQTAVAPSIACLILFAASFSNSFVVHEDRITMYLVQSLAVYRFLSSSLHSIKNSFSFAISKTKAPKRSQKWSFTCDLHPIYFVCFIISVRLGAMFYKCREEQIPCENSDLIVSLNKLHVASAYKVVRLVISLASLITPDVIFLSFISYKYSGRNQTLSAVCVKYGTFFICLMVCLRWWLNIVPPGVVNKILKGNEVFLTQTASVTCILICVVIFIFPVMVENPWTFSSRDIYNGSFASLLLIMLQLLYMVSGDASSPAIMLMALSAVFYGALIQHSSDPTESQLWCDAVTWSLLSRHWFYATTHQATFSTIQWDAAFLLNHGDIYSYILSGALVVINTFTSYIFFGLSFPLLLVWSDAQSYTSKGMLRLHKKYLFCFGFKAFGTMVAALILRRHLMVWKIFSPKLIFETIGVFITLASSLIGHFFIRWLTFRYHGIIRKNCMNVFRDHDD